MINLRIALFFALTGLVAACGGNVVVDVGGSGNAGGGGGTGGTGSGGFGAQNGTGGASCFNPPDPASLTFCGGSGSSGGTEVQCENDFCDANGDVWAAVCSATACQCLLNSVVMCTCAANTSTANFCGGTPTCCPLPKI